MRTLPVLVLLLGLTACGGGDDAPDPSAAASPTSAPAASAAPPVAPTTAAGATLLLRGKGLALQSGGSTVEIPFGSPTSVVVPALASTLGEPQQQTVECGQGPRTSVEANGFAVLFEGERFVGWDESGAGLATADGLRLGVTRADVVKALPEVEFSQSSLGEEFSDASGLSGFLDGPGDTAAVTGLVGGEACVVR